MTFIHVLTGTSSGILSDISSDILFGILSGISSGILSGKSSGILSGISSGILSGISSGWGPAGNTGRGWSWLRSGREHWAWMVVVEVRQGTLGVDGRGWGPTENTVDRESQLSRRTRRTTRGGGQREEEEDEEEEDQATDIKSNNPHLAGGKNKVWVGKKIETMFFIFYIFVGRRLYEKPIGKSFVMLSLFVDMLSSSRLDNRMDTK